MLSWFTKREYNRFDLIWIAWFTLAFSDERYFVGFVALACGATISGLLEGVAKNAAKARARTRQKTQFSEGQERSNVKRYGSNGPPPCPKPPPPPNPPKRVP